MLNYEILPSFVYFLILLGGHIYSFCREITLNSCIRRTLYCHLFRQKQRLVKQN